jgi:predicted XRE-type DNA-binding protein
MDALMSDAAEDGSGNIFADLGLPDAIELDARVALAAEILRLVKGRRPSRAGIASTLNLKASVVSRQA